MELQTETLSHSETDLVPSYPPSTCYHGLPNRYEAGRMILNPDDRSVQIGEDVYWLTPMEFRILSYLARRKGEIVERNQIYMDLLGREYDGLDRAIDLQISRIRKKIGENARSETGHIHSIRSIGYCFLEH